MALCGIAPVDDDGEEAAGREKLHEIISAKLTGSFVAFKKGDQTCTRTRSKHR